VRRRPTSLALRELGGGAQGRWVGATTCAERGATSYLAGVTSLQANPVVVAARGREESRSGVGGNEVLGSSVRWRGSRGGAVGKLTGPKINLIM
jgi:hypothetical protein